VKLTFSMTPAEDTPPNEATITDETRQAKVDRTVNTTDSPDICGLELSLCRVLRDVDTVAINICVESSWPAGIIDTAGQFTSRFTGLAVVYREGEVSRELHSASQFYLDRLFSCKLCRQGYCIPVVFDYVQESGEYLGCVVLLNRKGSVDISPRTIDLMRQFSPILRLMLKGIISRHMLFSSYNVGTVAPGSETTVWPGLTPRESHVFALHSKGWKYKDIAEHLHIGIDTVKKHVKSIYSKTGTRSRSELLLKYWDATISSQSI
jgi:DNA-binding CsgD family transcriptional regulator